MSVSLVLVIVMGVLYSSGVYLMLERSLTRVIVGFLLISNATSLLLLIMAGEAGTAPIVVDGAETGRMTDPLPQALVLTAIVITFSVTAFLLGLLYRSWRLGSLDQVADDTADVAMRGVTVMSAEQIDEAASDTEFAPKADAPRTEGSDSQAGGRPE